MLVPPAEPWVSLDWLEIGIARFRGFHFDPDFHNGRYARFLDWRPKGITIGTWSALARELRDWGALQHISDDVIQTQGEDRLSRLDAEFKKLLLAHPRRDPDLEVAQWEEVAPLYEAARNVNIGKDKPIDKPIIPSKLCHFLVPSAFPVADDKFVGVAQYPYESYWSLCKAGWVECGEKAALKARLRAEIEKDRRRVIEQYPWSAKITELCFAAYNHRTPAPQTEEM